MIGKIKPTAKKSFRQFLRHNIRTVLAGEILLGMVFSVTSFFLFTKIAEETVEKEGSTFDIALSHAIYAMRNPQNTEVMKFFSIIGNEGLFIATVLIVVILLVTKRTNLALLFGFTIFVGNLLNGFAKQLLQIPRPTLDPLIIEKFYSFPSGHAMNSFIFFSMLTYVVFVLTRNKLYTFFSAIACGMLILIIGFSRIYLGVHFPSDIIAGFIAGFWWVVTVIVFDRLLRFYHLYRQG